MTPPPGRACRLARAATVLALVVHGHAAAQSGAPWQRCRLADGSARLVQASASAGFALALSGCSDAPELRRAPAGRPVDASSDEPVARDDASPADAWAAADAAIEVRLIEAPATMPSRQQPSQALPPPPPPAPIAGWMAAAGMRHSVPAAVLRAVMYAESGYEAQARSPKGALGLMQLMPATARRYGIRSEAELLDPRTNIDTGARYLSDLLHQFGGRLDLALAAYNAGEGAVIACGHCVPPFDETRRYVRKILGWLGRRA
jgi:soluble lytic murein transglycosylase-like protein